MLSLCYRRRVKPKWRRPVPDILVRDVGPEVVERLKQRAQAHRRSLQGEVKAILEDSTELFDLTEMAERSTYWHERLAGRPFGDSSALILEDRER